MSQKLNIFHFQFEREEFDTTKDCTAGINLDAGDAIKDIQTFNKHNLLRKVLNRSMEECHACSYACKMVASVSLILEA